MLKTVFSKVMWVGRATTFAVGLAVILALTVGLATTALAGNGDPFKLGKSNTASKVSKLIKSGAGPALELQVDSGAPLAVNSDTEVANLRAANATQADSATNADSADNADKLDGKEAPLVASVNLLGNASTEDTDVVSSQKRRTGVYSVQFARDVSSCHQVASLGTDPATQGSFNPNTFNGEIGQVSTFNFFDPNTLQSQPDKIAVATYDSAGTLTDKSFHLAVFC